MTKRTPRARADNADLQKRVHYAIMHDEALRLAHWINLGLEMSPGDLDRLARMPPAVQDAVLAQRRATSRYLPVPLQRHRTAFKRARAQGRAHIEPEEWSPSLARHLKAPLAYDDPGRIVTVRPPAYTNGSRKIIATIAADAGVSPATIRAWAGALRDALEETDVADCLLPRRPVHARRRLPGKRAAK
jgi:hypothetical protein